MEKVHFKLNEEMTLKDELGHDYIYEMTPHPTAEDIRVVHFKRLNGRWDSVNYEVSEVEEKFKKGIWLMQ